MIIERFMKGCALLKILFLADLHYVNLKDWIDFLNKYKNSNEYDLLITLGDIDHLLMKSLQENIKKPMGGVLGNHDYFDDLPYFGIKDLNCKAVKFQETTICGLQGSIKYKNSDYPLYTQNESIDMCKKLPHTDIFISHSPPKGIHDRKDFAHNGLMGITNYIKKQKPKYCFHGHIHEDRITNFKKTIIISIYGGAIFDTNTAQIEKILDLY